MLLLHVECKYYILSFKENINILMHSRTRSVGKILAKENHLEDLGVDGRKILELIFKGLIEDVV
jgi:hypothetical protein